jgi:hypothetical protein
LFHATCATVVKCTISADTVYITKKGERGNWMKTHQTFPKKSISTANRFCRFGAGHEEHVGVGDTPGFDCDPNPSITPEGHGFTNHLVFWSPRNTRRMVQTFLFLT